MQSHSRIREFAPLAHACVIALDNIVLSSRSAVVPQPSPFSAFASYSASYWLIFRTILALLSFTYNPQKS
jgi:hypothetical protein